MESADQEILRAYLERVNQLHGQRAEQLTREDLKAIARELGASEADLQAADEAFNGHLQRGQGFLHHARWDDAIAELSSAFALGPDSTVALEALARAHKGRWQLSRGASDRNAAQRLARRMLELDPRHEPSFLLLNELDQPAPARPPTRVGQATVRVLSIVLGSALLFGLLYVRISRPMRRYSPRVSYAPRVPVIPPLAPAGGGTRFSSKLAAPPEMPEVDVPVELASSPKAAAFKLTTRLSRLRNYRESSYYTLHAALLNQGQTEVRKIRLLMELRDARGTIIGADAFAPLDTYQAPILPGDTHVFDKLQKTTPGLAGVRLTIQLVDEEPAAPTAPATKPVDLQWAFERPSHLAIEVRERRQSVSKNAFAGGLHHDAVLEVKNVGKSTVTKLKLEVRYFDGAKTLLKSNDFLVTFGGAPSLLPGETRLRRTLAGLPPSYAQYSVVVLEAE